MTYVNGQSVIAVGVLFLILSVVVVCARFYVRLRRKYGLGIDDWLCLPALASTSSKGQSSRH